MWIHVIFGATSEKKCQFHVSFSLSHQPIKTGNLFNAGTKLLYYLCLLFINSVEALHYYVYYYEMLNTKQTKLYSKHIASLAIASSSHMIHTWKFGSVV